MQECRDPVFKYDQEPKRLGTIRYLWGNMPSIDVLQLSSNEGVDYSKDLNILFAGMEVLVIVWSNAD